MLLLFSRCLDVPLFERGYGKDAAAICREALAHAQHTGADVVLVDTAGRMQVMLIIVSAVYMFQRISARRRCLNAHCDLCLAE